MKNQFHLRVWIAVCTLFFASSVPGYAVDSNVLLRAIEEKSKKLSELNTQIQETQKNLSATVGQNRSLSTEIKNYNTRINQLNLFIKSSEIKIEKLGLEIESLEDDIGAKEGMLAAKKATITRFLREIQNRDRDTTLVVLLKNTSLAESVSEAQALSSLNGQLSDEITTLQNLHEALVSDLDDREQKKTSIESENQNLKSRKIISEEQKRERAELLKITKNQEKIYQEQLSALEKQQDEIASEIEAIERELRASIDPSTLPTAAPGILKWPAASTYVSQGYGRTSFAKVTYKSQYHNGIDIAGPIGTEIFAASDGIVMATGNQDQFCPRAAYGKFVVVRHYNGLTTLYSHLSQINTAVGAQVKRGETIAYMGKTGWATGPHLHFTVWSTPTFAMRGTRVCGPMPVGGDLNPFNYLSSQTAKL